MSDDSNRKMRAMDAKRKHTASQEFAGVRQWYYSLPVEDRHRLRQDIQSLAEIAARIAKKGDKGGQSPISRSLAIEK